MYLEAINSKRQKIFQKLKNFPQFYLAGGTALALQIGHRMSDDFDLFTEKDIPADLLEKVEKIFKDSKINIITNHSEQLSLIVDQTKVDFVKYPFSLILDLTEYEKVKIIKILETAAMKAYTIGRRATYKDYIDLYFILSEKHSSLPEIIKISKEKFKEHFDPRLFLEQLVYLEDIQEGPIQFLKKKVGKKELEDFFQEEIKRIKL
jgi:predicted nucleotidyltransferase component of viral defense system